jgi:uncharacterized protein (DUF4415 family)
MNAKSKKSAPPWVDPEDAPEVTLQWVAEADLYAGEKLVRRGRPLGSIKAAPKVSTTIRFDPDVLAALKTSGKGWQTRVNAAMREWLKTHSST